MTNVIVGTQIIRRIVRFKMHGQHVINIGALKGGFITINIVCILLVDCLYIFKQNRGMQHIILIKQADIFTRCQLQAGIGIAGNT